MISTKQGLSLAYLQSPHGRPDATYGGKSTQAQFNTAHSRGKSRSRAQVISKWQRWF